MGRATRSKAVQLSSAVFRQLLRAYPKAYRDRYGVDMERVFQDCCQSAHSQRGAIGLVFLWIPTLLDVFRAAVQQHRNHGISQEKHARLRSASFATLLIGIVWSLTPYGAVRGILVAPFIAALGLLGLSLTAERGQGARMHVETGRDVRIDRARKTLFATLIFVSIYFYNDFMSATDEGLAPLGGRAGYLSMAASHLAFFLLGIWLYQRRSPWALFPAIMIGAAWMYFRSSDIGAIVSGQFYGDPTSLIAHIGSFAFAVAATLTSILAIPALWDSGKPGEGMDLTKTRRTG